jgi:hypothetical protein
MGCAQPINQRSSIGLGRVDLPFMAGVSAKRMLTTGARNRTGRDPPRHLRLQLA